MVHTSYVAHNVCIWMKFAQLYKGVILTVQGKCSIGQDKCSNYIRGIQYYHLWNILINFRQLFFFVLSSKDCTLLRYTFLHYTLILYTLFNSHITIQILTLIMMFREILFLCFISFFKSNHWKHGSHIICGT